MTTLTVLADDEAPVATDLDGGRATIAAADLPSVLGWELKPEGLCRGDVCVPVRDRASLGDGDRLDLGAVADALDRPFLLAADDGLAAVGEPRADRRAALAGRRAPSFTLPGADGRDHDLEEFLGRKVLLVAFASW